MIGYLSAFWREDGHEVVHVFGTDRYVPADRDPNFTSLRRHRAEGPYSYFQSPEPSGQASAGWVGA